MVTRRSAPETGINSIIQYLRMSLHALGITYTRCTKEALPSAAAINAAYDAIILPRVDTGGYGATIDLAGLTVPIFCMRCDPTVTAGNMGSVPGVSGTPAGYAEQFLTVPSTQLKGAIQSGFFPSYAMWYTSTVDATPIYTAAATDPITGGAQAQAGKISLWYVTNGSHVVYYSSEQPTDCHSLITMIEAAIQNGHLSAAVAASLKKVPLFFDFDHINERSYFDPAVGGNIAFLDRLIDGLPNTATVWCGIYNAADSDISNMSSDMLSRLKTHSGKKFRYCWHTHNATRAQPVTGNYPYPARGGTLADVRTKAQQSSDYAYDKTLWEAQGLTFHIPGYYDSGGNRFNEDTLALYSQDVSIASDPNSAASQAGLGFLWFRTQQNITTRPVKAGYSENQLWQKKMMRGILVMKTDDLGIGGGLSFATAVGWRQRWNIFRGNLLASGSVFIHAQDLSNPQSTSNVMGVEILAMLNQFCNAHPNTVVGFANALDYWNGRTLSAA